MFKMSYFKLKKIFSLVKHTHPKRLATLALMPTVYCAPSHSLENLPGLPTNLSHAFLIRQASSVAVNSASQLLTQTAVALLDLGEQYIDAVEDLMDLIEESQATINDVSNQQELTDLMVAARARVSEYKQQLLDVDSLLQYVEKVAEATAEASFLAGADFVSTHLSEKLYSTMQEVNRLKETIGKVEKECMLLQKNLIDKTKFENKDKKK